MTGCKAIQAKLRITRGSRRCCSLQGVYVPQAIPDRTTLGRGRQKQWQKPALVLGVLGGHWTAQSVVEQVRVGPRRFSVVGWGRVGSGGVGSGRVGSGGVGWDQVGSGRVGSGLGRPQRLAGTT